RHTRFKCDWSSDVCSSDLASCHGADGGGGFGPTLAGVVVKRYPNPADQEAVVANGRGSMPSFADSLTPAQITAVVAYTRTKLGRSEERRVGKGDTRGRSTR